MRDDFHDMARDDLQKARELSTGETDRTLPALVEMAFGGLTAISALVWFVALWLWVPEPVDGTTWMSLGGLALTLFGGPAVLIYGLRRGLGEAILRLAGGI